MIDVLTHTGSSLAPCTASTHTHGLSGSTSQFPFARTPPHGPLRKFLGQRIGHVSPVECKMHCPHMRQSQIASLDNSSIGSKKRSRRLVKTEFSERRRRGQERKQLTGQPEIKTGYTWDTIIEDGITIFPCYAGNYVV